MSVSSCWILIRILPLESTRRVLSDSTTYNKIQQELADIWRFEHEAREFSKMELTVFSLPLLIILYRVDFRALFSLVRFLPV